MRRPALLIVFVFFASFADPLAASEYGARMELKDGLRGIPAATATSLIAILGRPEEWDGEAVQVSGWLKYDPHGTHLFMSSEWCERFGSEYAVRVDVERLGGVREMVRALGDNCHYGSVQGIIRMHRPQKPRPDTIIIRPTPGVLHAQFVVLE